MTEGELLHVDCDRHGRGVAAVVCGHLTCSAARGLGFVENSSVPGDLQGWCGACEAKFLEEGELTEVFRAFHRMALVCETCYGGIRARNELLAEE